MTSVILIEDDKDLRDSLVECLQLNSIDAKGVGSALNFYKALDERPYDIAVVDIGLPDQNGFIVSEYIRSNTRMGVIILTAMGEPEDRSKGFDSGADIYFTKPIKCMELASAVGSLARRLGEANQGLSNIGMRKAWALNIMANELSPPDKTPIRLTEKEGAFMRLVGEAPDHKMDRDIILGEMRYQHNQYGDRALNALVLRLRKKIENATGEESPLRTAHASGFYFAEPIVIR